MPDFIPGLELGRLFYNEAVRPILAAHWPGLPHDAGRIGTGSDILGFDTPMSTDHDWGPSVFLFLREEDLGLAAEIKRVMSAELPRTFRGYSTHFGESPLEEGTFVMWAEGEGPINHRVHVTTLRGYVRGYLDFDLNDELQPTDWLTIPSQRLRTLTAGAVYHEDLGELSRMRERLAYFPRDVWLYMMAAGWKRISQEEHLMPRAGYADDELGSSLIGSRLVRDIMMLCFLQEKQYAPYPKWFGTAFNRLAIAEELSPILDEAQASEVWQDRELALSLAYSYIAQAHNALRLTAPLPDVPTQFFNRPFHVIWGERFTDALVSAITDPAVKQIAARTMIGSIDQFSDSTDLQSDARWRKLLVPLYQGSV